MPTTIDILASLGAGIGVVLGFCAVLAPHKIEQLVGLQPGSPEGISEIRATYGGFFIGMGLYSLWAQNESIFTLMAVAWLSAAFVRLITLSRNVLTAKNMAGVVFESAIGLLLLSCLI